MYQFNVFLLSFTKTFTILNLALPNAVTTNYSNSLTNTSQTFTRYNGSGVFHYEMLEIVVTLTGTYTFTCQSHADTYGYLYVNTFNSLNVNVNLIAQDNDNGGNFQFSITIVLQAGATYILVVTTYTPGVTTNFSITTSGPASIALPNITAMTTTSPNSTISETTSTVTTT
ncbi:unnamed protein product, partial [Rotaria sp. Silwood2]